MVQMHQIKAYFSFVVSLNKFHQNFKNDDQFGRELRSFSYFAKLDFIISVYIVLHDGNFAFVVFCHGIQFLD